MHLDLNPATEADYDLINNLARFYVYDMSEHTGWHFPADGLFDPQDRFANYWGRKSALYIWPPTWRGFPFLIRIDEHPAGFALVKQIRDNPPTFDMGEFFVARQHRRHGIGQRVAATLFDRFPGRWEVRQIPSNTPAQAFWRRIIGNYTDGEFTETRETFPAYENREFIVQRFQSRARAPKQESRA
jgi:predicted acetyltransferase